MQPRGEVREWLKRAASKAAIGESLSGVQIPPSPPSYLHFLSNSFFLRSRFSEPTCIAHVYRPPDLHAYQLATSV